MDINTAKRNLEKFEAHPHGKFNVSNEKLVYVPKWNIIGRLVRWIQNKDQKVTDKVQTILDDSKIFIYEANQKQLLTGRVKIKNRVDTHLEPYFRGNITETTDDKKREPLIVELYQEFPQISKEDLSKIALDSYITASAMHFQQMMAIHKGDYDPNTQLLPALKAAIEIDFKGIKMSPERINSKIHDAVNRVDTDRKNAPVEAQVKQYMKELIIRKAIKRAAASEKTKTPLMTILLKINPTPLDQAILQEAVIEKYLGYCKAAVKEKIALAEINPDNAREEVNLALAKHLPDLKKRLEKNFPELSQEAIDTRAKDALKELVPYLLYELKHPIK